MDVADFGGSSISSCATALSSPIHRVCADCQISSCTSARDRVEYRSDAPWSSIPSATARCSVAFHTKCAVFPAAMPQSTARQGWLSRAARVQAEHSAIRVARACVHMPACYAMSRDLPQAVGTECGDRQFGRTGVVRTQASGGAWHGLNGNSPNIESNSACAR